MKKSLLIKLVFVTILAALLSGCIVEPWGEDEGREHRQSEYWHDHYGDHHHEYYEHGDYDDHD